MNTLTTLWTAFLLRSRLKKLVFDLELCPPELALESDPDTVTVNLIIEIKWFWQK